MSGSTPPDTYRLTCDDDDTGDEQRISGGTQSDLTCNDTTGLTSTGVGIRMQMNSNGFYVGDYHEFDNFSALEV